MNNDILSRYYNPHQSEDYSDFISRVSKFDITGLRKDISKIARSITVQVTDRCNLACTYCYQINKCGNRMNLDTGKKFIDLLLTDDKSINSYINRYNTDVVILDFIGGEPLLEIDLIDQLSDYFVQRMIELDHPWLPYYILSIGTNGVLYFDERVQRYIDKHLGRLSINITVDGNKELHDACRVFHNGKGSYDLAVAATKDWMQRTNASNISTKITIAPENVSYLSKAIISMIDIGFTNINENCVYEKGWTLEHAKILYNELKKLADYVIENNLEKTHNFRIFNPDWYKPMDPKDNDNWCGGNAQMLAVDPKGNLYNCLRYMPSSLGPNIVPLTIGHVDRGISITPCDKNNIKCMSCISRRSQSTDECFYCPIATGCGWCSAYNYQVFGTCNKRATYVCEMHKAASLASVYYWNSIFKKYQPEDEDLKNFRMNLNCPKEWALNIIDENEYNLLLELSRKEV